MKIISKIIIFVLIFVAFTAGIFYQFNVLNFYNILNKSIQEFRTTDFSSVVNQASKDIMAPQPLIVNREKGVDILLQSKIITETNRQRLENGGLPALIENTFLDDAAAAKANDIFLNQYFEHVSPSGVGPGDLAIKYGYDYITEGENLILGKFSSEKEVVQDWMNSPGHRANILNNRYTEIGVAMIKGIYKGDTVWVGVQEFGLPLSTCSQPNAGLKSQIDADNSQLDVILSQIDESKKQLDSTNPSSSAYGQMINDYNNLIARYNSLASQAKANVATYNDQVNNFNTCLAGTK